MSSFRDAWVRADAVATALVPRHFDNQTARLTATQRAAGRKVDPVVVRELLAQNSGRAVSAELSRALAAVQSGAFAVVVTGQQVGLLGGPLYAAHKAASAVALAARLSRESGVTVLPVFWLQTEDHDVEEIASTVLIDARGAAHRLAVEFDAPAPRSSVAHVTLPASTEALRSRATSALRDLSAGADAVAIAEAALVASSSAADSFVALFDHIFADTPLLFFSPRTPAIAAQVAPIHRWALENVDAIDAALAESTDALTAAGFAPQVPPRTGCALTFVHPEGISGPRQRPRQNGDLWCFPGEADDVSTATLLEWLRDEPMRFSSSALVRPLIQDSLLPTAAWIGGPAELAYMAQLGGLYRLFGLEQPLVFARRHVRWVLPSVQKVLAEHSLTVDDLLAPIEQIVAKLGPSSAPGPESQHVRDLVATPALEALEALRAELQWADGLDKAIEKTREAISTSVDRLCERVERARIVADAPRLEPIRAARRWMEVDGVAQERVLNALSVIGSIGVGRFAELLLVNADPVETSRAEIVP